MTLKSQPLQMQGLTELWHQSVSLRAFEIGCVDLHFAAQIHN